jgi:hypothetical protein
MKTSSRTVFGITVLIAVIYVVATYFFPLHEVRTDEPPSATTTLWTFDKLSALGCLLASIFVGVIGRMSAPYRLLAAGFLLWGTWIGDSGSTNTLLVDLWIPSILAPISVFFFLRFWLDVSTEVGIAETELTRTFSRFATVLLVICLLCSTIAYVVPENIRHIAESTSGNVIPVLANSGATILMLFCVAAALRVLLKTPPVSSNKIFWVATSLLGFFAIYIFKGIVVTLLFLISLDLNASWISAIFSVLEPIQPLCALGFLYVCLAKRLISFNFVINRFLVYTVAGGLLIIGFWFLKTGLEGNSIFDAEANKNIVNGSAAFLIFIAKQFSGVTDNFLKKTIFFRLGKREQRLRRFIDEMAHFESSEALKSEFQKSLSEFFRGTTIELYERREGAYIGQISGKQIPADDLLPVGLRASKTSMHGAELVGHDEFRLVLPCIHRGSLIGFVALIESSDLPSIRPDEIRLTESAIQQLVSNLAFLELARLNRLNTSPSDSITN